MKVKLIRDKVISITGKGEQVGVYFLDRLGEEILLAELSPKKADKLIAYWEKL